MKKSTSEVLVNLYIEEKIKVLGNLPVKKIAEVAEVVWMAYENQNTVYACGNGGNAGYVANLITDFANHPFVSEDKHNPLPRTIPRLRAIDLTQSGATLTAITNDIGFNYIFSQQLINDKISEGDIVFGFSGSGNSGNILEAFQVAEQHGAETIAVTRGSGGKVKKLADYCIIIPGTSTFPGQTGGNDNNFHYEDALSFIAHMITGNLVEKIKDKYLK